MKLVWAEQLPGIRKKEAEIILSELKGRTFNRTLEIGSGEGYQSRELAKISKKLVCSEYLFERIKKIKEKNIEYMTCDAENLKFENESFDLIFSSNLLEHLKSPEKALREMKRCLKKDGLMIHSIPNEYMKILHIVLFYPQMLIRFIEKIKRGSMPVKTKSFNNNPKSSKRNSLFKKVFLHPHGEHKTNLDEVIHFRNISWIRLFRKSNLIIHKRIKLKYYSPYGFGFKRFHKFMEKLGYCTSYAYIMSKR